MPAMSRFAPIAVLCGLASANPAALLDIDALKTLGNSMGQVVPDLRRLQNQQPPPAGPRDSAACLQACPGYQTVMETMAGMANATQGASADPTAMIGQMMDMMCNNQETYTCMASNEACLPEAPPQGGGGARRLQQDQGPPPMNMADPVSMSAYMGCICDACPGFMNSFMTVFQTIMTFAFSGADPADSLTSICPLLGPLVCITTESECSTFVATQQGLGDITGAFTPLVDNCTDAGIGTNYPTAAPTTTTTTTVDAAGGAGTAQAALTSLLSAAALTYVF